MREFDKLSQAIFECNRMLLFIQAFCSEGLQPAFFSSWK